MRLARREGAQYTVAQTQSMRSPTDLPRAETYAAQQGATDKHLSTDTCIRGSIILGLSQQRTPTARGVQREERWPKEEEEDGKH